MEVLMHIVLLVFTALFTLNSFVISWMLVFHKIPQDSISNAGIFLAFSAIIAVGLLVGTGDLWPSAEKTITEEEKEE